MKQNDVENTISDLSLTEKPVNYRAISFDMQLPRTSEFLMTTKFDYPKLLKTQYHNHLRANSTINMSKQTSRKELFKHGYVQDYNPSSNVKFDRSPSFKFPAESVCKKRKKFTLYRSHWPAKFIS